MNAQHNHEPEYQRGGLRFDPTINLGHVLTFIGFMISAMVVWGTLDKRITVLEEARLAQAERDKSQDTRMLEKMQEFREQLTFIGHNIEKIREKLDMHSTSKP